MSLLHGMGDLARRRLAEDADELVGPALFTLLPEDAAVDTFNLLRCVAVLSFLLAVIHLRYFKTKAMISN